MFIGDHSPMPFGKYLGKAMLEVPAVYLLWLFNKGCQHPDVKRYILENYDAIKNEAQKVKR